MQLVLTEQMDNPQSMQAGLATAEYAVATIAAVGFAGLLIAIQKSPAVHAALEGIVKAALTIPG